MSEKIYGYEETAIINTLLASENLDKDLYVFIKEVEDRHDKTRIRFEEIMKEREKKLQDTHRDLKNALETDDFHEAMRLYKNLVGLRVNLILA